MDNSHPFREMMEKLLLKLYKLKKEYEEAKEDKDMEAITAGEVLISNTREVISMLFSTMKKAGMLTKEEIEFGALKKRDHES